MRPGSVTITVTPPSGTDWRGDPTGDGAADFTVPGCKKWPGQTVEATTLGEDVAVEMWVWVPPGSPEITAVDKVRLDGDERPFNVWTSAEYENGRGVDKGQIVGLQKRGTKK